MKKIVLAILIVLFPFLTLPTPISAANHTIDNFESGNVGWINGQIASGYNSSKALRLTNIQNNGITVWKDFNSPLLNGYTHLELDVNLNGTRILDKDASAIVFEQAGWKMVSLSNYVQNGQNGWQHVKIPLTDFARLDTNNGIASVIFRFWNDQAGNYDFDNLALTTSGTTSLTAPTNLTGSPASTSQINLNWQGQGPQYKIYRNNQHINTVSVPNYSDTGLSTNTEYSYYIIATNGTQDSAPSNTISVRTLNNSVPPVGGDIIADFEAGLSGFDQGQLTGGLNSSQALRLSHSAYNGIESKKILDSTILKGKTNLELDINLNGGRLLTNDASAIVFEQAGWKMVSLSNYVQNGQNGWQHVKIPLSNFSSLNTNDGVAYILFRFWNDTNSTYDIDNIKMTGSGTVDPTVQTPTNLQGTHKDGGISLTWSGTGPNYKVFRNNNQIGTTNNPTYTDTNVSPNTTYSYFVKATNGSTDSNPSNTVSVSTPNTTPATGWQIQSIDSQIMSKYWGINDDNQIRSLVKANKALGADIISISINYDYYPLIKKWADIIHSEGLKVWFKGHWNEWDSWEDPSMRRGITSTEYLNKTKQFILDHPDLFRAGDVFTMATESENAAWHTGIDSGPFNGWESWRSFIRNEIAYSNDAFNRIGLGGQVKTNLINMNGWVAWNILDQNTVNAMGVLTLDHIIDWTDDINTYKAALFQGNSSNGYIGYDQLYNKWHVPIVAGEWGYSTFNSSLDPYQQKNMAQAIYDEFSKRNYIQGINYWIDVGHASRLFDTSNLLDYTPRPITSVIKQYYN